jgi:hypothetical protein
LKIPASINNPSLIIPPPPLEGIEIPGSLEQNRKRYPYLFPLILFSLDSVMDIVFT